MVNKMGKTTVKVKIRNFGDIFSAENGYIKKSEIRGVEIEAIVDSGAAYLCLPSKIIKELCLYFSKSTQVKTGNGSIQLRIFIGAEITIKDRTIQMQVMENVDDSVPAIIGYLVLETMDWVLNPKNQELMGNPENDGKWVVDMY